KGASRVATKDSTTVDEGTFVAHRDVQRDVTQHVIEHDVPASGLSRVEALGDHRPRRVPRFADAGVEKSIGGGELVAKLHPNVLAYGSRAVIGQLGIA